MRAGRLSVASTLGEDKILKRESDAMAFTKIRTFPGPKMPVTPNGDGVMAVQLRLPKLLKIPVRTLPRDGNVRPRNVVLPGLIS